MNLNQGDYVIIIDIPRDSAVSQSENGKAGLITEVYNDYYMVKTIYTINHRHDHDWGLRKDKVIKSYDIKSL